ncbi:MAG: PIN domain-containing protein [Verrucomicrobia bacterium]|nr:PIN domain-containing protein [Verrucomicrobiota bacterium]
MILLDTNVLIYAGDQASPFHQWASDLIAEAVAGGEGVCANAVSLAEVCVGDTDPASVSQRIAAWGVELVAVPPTAAAGCASAYVIYRARRKADSGKDSPTMPLPDFFIGAHAQVMGWTVATGDTARFKTYFPSLQIVSP